MVVNDEHCMTISDLFERVSAKLASLACSARSGLRLPSPAPPIIRSQHAGTMCSNGLGRVAKLILKVLRRSNLVFYHHLNWTQLVDS